MKRAARVSETISLGAVLVIECDGCKCIIDALTEDWVDDVASGEMYAGRNICWECKEKEDNEKG